MYIWVTDRCNMQCRHCCNEAKFGKGTDMSMKTFERCLEVAEEYGDESIALGGGEPTLHPKFEEMLVKAMAIVPSGYLFVATNGLHTKRALLLAKLTKAEVISAVLSTDEYHDLGRIDPEVWAAFEGHYRDVTDGGRYEPKAEGRALWSEKDGGLGIDANEAPIECACPELSVLPDGTVKQCGCSTSPILGNIHDINVTDRIVRISMCYQEMMVELDKEERAKILPFWKWPMAAVEIT